MKWLVAWLKPYLLPLVAALVFGGAGLGYWAGDHNRNNAWLAKQAKTDAAAQKAYVAEVNRGQAASGAFIVEHQALQSDFQKLTEKFNGLSKRVPLLLAGGGGACADGANKLAPEPKGQPPLRPEALDGSEPAGGGGPVLTAGAVWMWDSSLTGKDQPTGACSAANTTQAACAVATGVTLDDAWRNHTTNAKLCAEDRLVHQRLIDFLTRRESTQP